VTGIVFYLYVPATFGAWGPVKNDIDFFAHENPPIRGFMHTTTEIPRHQTQQQHHRHQDTVESQHLHRSPLYHIPNFDNPSNRSKNAAAAKSGAQGTIFPS
jgi:hypothetical protein